MPITYREGKDIPIDDLTALYTSVNWEWFVPRLPDIVRGSTWAIGAWDGPRLVGFARVISDDVCESVLHNVCVHPNYQRLGIGGEIVERVATRFAHTRILLTRLHHHNDFYARHGFHVIDHAMERRY